MTQQTKPKLMIMGYARHGKDTVCDILKSRYGFNFISSSFFCAERVLFPMLKERYGYADVQACYDDRSEHRAEWFDAIHEFNNPDLGKLGRAILREYDIYCGIRNAREFHALKNSGAFDVSIWVDASHRREPEPKDSCTVEPWMADYILDNNGSVAELEFNLEILYRNKIEHAGEKNGISSN